MSNTEHKTVKVYKMDTLQLFFISTDYNTIGPLSPDKADGALDVLLGGRGHTNCREWDDSAICVHLASRVLEEQA